MASRSPRTGLTTEEPDDEEPDDEEPDGDDDEKPEDGDDDAETIDVPGTSIEWTNPREFWAAGRELADSEYRLSVQLSRGHVARRIG